MRHLFIHTVTVERANSIPNAEMERTGERETVVASMRCRVEPLVERQKESILGRLANATFKMMWGTEALQNGDVVTFEGEGFVLQEITRDTSRPTLRYQTGILVGRP